MLFHPWIAIQKKSLRAIDMFECGTIRRVLWLSFDIVFYFLFTGAFSTFHAFIQMALSNAIKENHCSICKYQRYMAYHCVAASQDCKESSKIWCTILGYNKKDKWETLLSWILTDTLTIRCKESLGRILNWLRLCHKTMCTKSLCKPQKPLCGFTTTTISLPNLCTTCKKRHWHCSK